MAAVMMSMSIVLVIAVLALAYAAWLHRGKAVPGASWLDEVFDRVHDTVPHVRDGDLDAPTPADTSLTRSPARPSTTMHADGLADKQTSRGRPRPPLIR